MGVRATGVMHRAESTASLGGLGVTIKLRALTRMSVGEVVASPEYNLGRIEERLELLRRSRHDLVIVAGELLEKASERVSATTQHQRAWQERRKQSQERIRASRESIAEQSKRTSLL